MIADKDTILAPGAEDEKVVGLGREGVLMVFGGVTCLPLRGIERCRIEHRGARNDVDSLWKSGKNKRNVGGGDSWKEKGDREIRFTDRMGVGKEYDAWKKMQMPGSKQEKEYQSYLSLSTFP
jgi:hypothetical protein